MTKAEMCLNEIMSFLLRFIVCVNWASKWEWIKTSFWQWPVTSDTCPVPPVPCIVSLGCQLIPPYYLLLPVFTIDLIVSQLSEANRCFRLRQRRKFRQASLLDQEFAFAFNPFSTRRRFALILSSSSVHWIRKYSILLHCNFPPWPFS